ncbi:MAG: YdcF family protein [Leptolyngbyaceae cyanobacterium SM1_3_5]|nr:YdcF family protein [Leptolyngbyaceae cyanobacterium SM1_3_5]
MNVLILLVSLWILWQASTRRWRRWLIHPFAVGLLLYCAATSPIAIQLATQALTASLPTDLSEKVDAIVVLGRGEELRDPRADLTRSLWKANRAPRIFASGMLDARSIVQFLQESGITASALGGEECSQTTAENGLFTAAILHRQPIQKILLVTDPPHMLRSFLVFRSFGFTVTPSFSPLPPNWSTQRQAHLLLREYLALAQYAVSGQFQQHPLAERTASLIRDGSQPPAAVLAKISEWNCLVKAQ